MYHAHFGLQKGLFGDGIAADTAVFRSPRHEQVSAHFKLALGGPSSCVVLRGPPGVGKTTLTAATLRASSTRLALAWLNGVPTNAAELLELVLVELGVNTVRTTRIERLQLWRQFQGEMRATESRLYVVVERAEDLEVEVLHALDQLTAPDAVGNPGANCVLLGHSTIDEHLAAPLLESLRQRIRVRTDLAPFGEGELQDYLRHQVACAGGHFDQIFAPGTVAALYRHSGGVARLTNTLCETALGLATSQQLKLLTPDLVTKTAVTLLGLAEAAPATRVAPPVVVAPAAVVAPPVVVVPPMVVAPPVVVAPTPAAVVAPVAAPAMPPTPIVAPAPIAVAAVAPAPAPAATVVPPAVVEPAPSAVQISAAAQPAAPAPSVVVARAPSLAAAPSAPTLFAQRAAAPAAPPAPIAPPAQPAAAAPAPAPTQPPVIEYEFDGGATDISDVAMADFPVLTDAVELPSFPVPAKRATAAAPLPTEPAPVANRASAPAAKPAAAPRAPAQAPTPTKPAAPAASRVETAYAPSKAASAAPKPAPVSAPAPVATPKPAAAQLLPADPEDDDLLRQTQTMRAIAVAKSIDDISSSMAETLFGDAELDLVTAALASAAEWPDDELEPKAAPATSAAKAEPAKPAKPAKPAPIDDPFDLFGLGDDAPLELIDDSTLPPIDTSRKSASR